MAISEIIKRTVWVSSRDGGFVAMDWKGNTLATAKFKSYIDFRWLKERGIEAWAIAPVIIPSNRILNRKPNRSKTLR